jgi:murein DD-endopeptidase MepM/ murein hydrolase activator NlpD
VEDLVWKWPQLSLGCRSLSVLPALEALGARVLLDRDWRSLPVLALWLLISGNVGCSRDAPTCGPYPDWKTSAYVLPFRPGERYRVWQGNCYRGHLEHLGGALRYSYDFEMPIGTPLVAVRSGRVAYTRTHFGDGNGGGVVGSDNVILIDHLDGTYALYGHLTFDGALVHVGDRVEQGQVVAVSGNTGMTGGIPHLHFMVSRCPSGDIPCGTELTSIPVTFMNTRANRNGLQTHGVYEATATKDESP